jgi:hypothetical protein
MAQFLQGRRAACLGSRFLWGSVCRVFDHPPASQRKPYPIRQAPARATRISYLSIGT